ncbi:hypothetical protein BKA67DRAFT_665285 [Truncatella angustata]|uniref:Uncharacterized protein n=1 Tax=Truncatella angustata TaxID=152316 RepID=A0A9P8RKE8_9PEZI|nr:uncharacterized protein BKA67DRAFT_665285 [Truncatella angustata]KAH6643479.1 hypothetical protein BKA67DRAFT_665285 [Truncatella angustata]KAH8195344.1 hypothetical protein TruAng_010493 [Truncatella angustata]
MTLRFNDAFLLFVAASSLLRAVAQDPFTFCKDDGCGDCPVSITSIGTGYPDCAIYNSVDVFGNQGFDEEKNFINAFLDVPQQDESQPCFIIFKSPADLQQPGCGEIQKTFQDATCGDIKLDTTFMVQFCCGNGDCAAAGIPGLPSTRSISQSAKFDRSMLAALASSGGGGLKSLRIAINGTEIQPAYVGSPPVTDSISESFIKKPMLARRNGVCAGDWVPVAGKEDYTRPADRPQIVSSVYTGPFVVQITQTRTQEWSMTIEASLGFEDVVSLGISFSSTFSESVSNSEAAQFTIAEGEKGYVAWNSFVRCSEGTGTCNDEQISGEVCTPYLDANSGKLAGEYTLVEQG